MLYRVTEPNHDRSDRLLVDVSKPFSWLDILKHRFLIAKCGVAFLLLGALFLLVRTPTYTSVSQLLLDHRVLRTAESNVMFAATDLNQTRVENQIAILQSDAILREVIAGLKLYELERFQKPEIGLFQSLPGYWSARSETVSPEKLEAQRAAENKRRENAALEILRTHLEVESTARSHAVEVRYTDIDPLLSAAITREVVNAYLRDQAAVNADSAQTASAWLRQRVSALGTVSRVLTEARVPLKPNGFDPIVILALSGVTGLLLGTAWGFTREITDRSVTALSQAEAITQMESLGVLPAVSAGLRWKFQDKSEAYTNPVLLRAIKHPLSGFAHTLRRAAAVAGSIKLPEAGLTLGIVSSAPGEGRTTVAINLARVMGNSGARVLLIDACPYNGRLSAAFGGAESLDLLEVLDGQTSLAEAVRRDSYTGVHVLPISVVLPRAVTTVIWTERMHQILAEAKKHYDYIVVDLPPMGPVADVRAAGRQIDYFLMVIEAGRTPADAVQRGLTAAAIPNDRFIGVILNHGESRPLRFLSMPKGQDRSYLNDELTLNVRDMEQV